MADEEIDRNEFRQLKDIIQCEVVALRIFSIVCAHCCTGEEIRTPDRDEYGHEEHKTIQDAEDEWAEVGWRKYDGQAFCPECATEF